jgi:hypothetical protein
MATTMANVSTNAATAPAGNAIETAHEDMIVSTLSRPVSRLQMLIWMFG